jgi:hypothetical protein
MSERPGDSEFTPAYPKEWETFWQTDICEKDKFYSWFPKLALLEAQRVWLAMEKHFLAKYEVFVRVWPEWGSSGIWAPPYPGSRAAGGMIGYEYFKLPRDLVGRFEIWQADFDEHGLEEIEAFDWDRHAQTADALARDLKAVLGPRIYVEHRELVEVLADGSTLSCRPRLGLPELAPGAAP